MTRRQELEEEAARLLREAAAMRLASDSGPVIFNVREMIRNASRLVGLAEVARLAGVSRSRAGQITAHPDFPAPIQRLAMGPVWLEADVKKFLALPRKPGRRPSARA